jgi:hypothetical protein
VHTEELNPLASLDARLAALREVSSSVLTPDDIEYGDSTVFNHTPSVSIAFDKTNHVVTVPAQYTAASSLPAGMVRWRSDFEEDRDRAAAEKAEDKRNRKANKLRKLKERDAALEASKPLQQRFEVAVKSNDWSDFTPAEFQQMQTAGLIKQVKQEVEIVQAKPISQRTVNFTDRLAEQNDRVRDRVLNGFHRSGGVTADRPYGEIHEFFGVGKYRSSLHPSFARVVQLLARAGRAVSGSDKREVIHHTKNESALLIRDAAYICGDPTRLGNPGGRARLDMGGLQQLDHGAARCATTEADAGPGRQPHVVVRSLRSRETSFAMAAAVRGRPQRQEPDGAAEILPTGPARHHQRPDPARQRSGPPQHYPF